MNIICDKEKCTGCGLCVSRCPKQCITMQSKGVMGHLIPEINQSFCIDCGLCQKSCPSNHPQEKKMPSIAYAAWAKDEEDYRTSTSGGAASVLSQYAISQGGVVYGCAMLPDLEVKHIRVDNYVDLRKLKGSKYVQSNIIEVIPQIQEDVKAGRFTLFIGTPCQVAAVKSLYKEQPANLLLVDLICHGIPSLKILKEHIYRVCPKPHYDKVIFRNEAYVVAIVVDGKIIYNKSLKDYHFREWYINTFFYGYTYRDSCYQCQYACPERCSDITIGDFWKLGKKVPANYIPAHAHGCSVLLPMTDAGKRAIDAITNKMNIYPREAQEAIDGNDQLRAPFKADWRIRFYRKHYTTFGHHLYHVLNIDNILLTDLRKIKKSLTKYIKK